MNDNFVNIKVDREERPDVDAQYMAFVRATTGGAGGWPLSVFLTPTLKRTTYYILINNFIIQMNTSISAYNYLL